MQRPYVCNELGAGIWRNRISSMISKQILDRSIAGQTQNFHPDSPRATKIAAAKTTITIQSNFRCLIGCDRSLGGIAFIDQRL